MKRDPPYALATLGRTTSHSASAIILSMGNAVQQLPGVFASIVGNGSLGDAGSGSHHCLTVACSCGAAAAFTSEGEE